MCAIADKSALQITVLHEGTRCINNLPGGSMHAPRTATTVSIASHMGPLEPPTVQVHTTSGTVPHCNTHATSHDQPSSLHACYSTELSSSYHLRAEKWHLCSPAHPGAEAPLSAVHTSAGPVPHQRKKAHEPSEDNTGVCATAAQGLRCDEMATGASLSALQALQVKGVSVLSTDAAGNLSAIQRLGRQLDRFKKRHLFLGQFEICLLYTSPSPRD